MTTDAAREGTGAKQEQVVITTSTSEAARPDFKSNSSTTEWMMVSDSKTASSWFGGVGREAEGRAASEEDFIFKMPGLSGSLVSWANPADFITFSIKSTEEGSEKSPERRMWCTRSCVDIFQLFFG